MEVNTVNYEFLAPTTIRAGDVDAINHLLRQLTDNPVPIVEWQLREVCEKSTLCVARNVEGRIVGMNTLTIRYIPTGKVGLLDDVVVDESARGHQVGRTLVSKLIEHAQSVSVNRLELTCRPARKAANALYEGLGFQRSETNRWVMKF